MAFWSHSTTGGNVGDAAAIDVLGRTHLVGSAGRLALVGAARRKRRVRHRMPDVAAAVAVKSTAYL